MWKFWVGMWGLLFFSEIAAAQYVQKVWEYRPAPGQFINNPIWGTPERANSLVGGLNGGISLGSLGGYIVLGFQKPIENDPQNPYGVDFTVFGNASAISAEPAFVWVMRDDNQNGVPDDTWYRLAGSHDYFTTTQHRSFITYFNPFSEKASPIPWEDSQGNAGSILANPYHGQPYYPLPNFFPYYPQEKVTFQTSRLLPNIRVVSSNYFELLPFAFGYADNRPRQFNVSVMLPDNPYTLDVLEGSGGDAMDIDWAVDEQGNYVYLDKIHFVKLQAACVGNVGWLGEISPEITGVVDIEPNPSLKGDTRCLVLNNIPTEMYPGEQFLCEAFLFEKGRPTHQPVVWKIFPTTAASIAENGLLQIAPNSAQEEVTLTATSGGIERKITISVLIPYRLESNIPHLWQSGQQQDLTAQLFDKKGNFIAKLSLGWESDNPSVVEVRRENQDWKAIARSSGYATLTVFVEAFPQVRASYRIEVTETILPLQCFISVLTPEETLFPVELTAVNLISLTNWIARPSKNYAEIRSYTLAHAVASFAAYYHDTYEVFNEHPRNRSLYVSKLKRTIGTTTFEYNGFGGQTEHGRHKAWGVIYQNRLYLDSLEYISLENNSSITLVYLPDIRQQQQWAFWQTTQPKGNRDTVFLVELLEGVWDKNHYQPRRLSHTTFFINQQPYSTNENGLAWLTFAEDRQYTLTYQNATLILYVGILTAFEMSDESLEIIVYPNPCRHFFFVGGKVLPQTSLTLYDATGKMMRCQPFSLNQPITVDFLPSGTYFLHIRHAQWVRIIPICVDK